MIKVEKIKVFNFEGAIRGMRNPMNSWDKSDSGVKCIAKQEFNEPASIYEFVIGKNDLELMHALYIAGPEHRKYLRQIFVSMDITAPLYWWKEFDTYKVGTTADSCSTMHKIGAKEFELDDFSYEHFKPLKVIDGNRGTDSFEFLTSLNQTIWFLNVARRMYLETENKDYWWQMIQLLPSSYNQKRTVTFTYENVMAMIKQRSGHKLDEWRNFVEILKDLPYVREIRMDEADNIRRTETDSKAES